MRTVKIISLLLTLLFASTLLRAVDQPISAIEKECDEGAVHEVIDVYIHTCVERDIPVPVGPKPGKCLVKAFGEEGLIWVLAPVKIGDRVVPLCAKDELWVPRSFNGGSALR